LPILLVFEGVNLHNAALLDVEQEPAYTDTSPFEEMEGMKAALASLTNGRSGVTLSRVKFD
jgi:hypothetical protein